MGCLAMLEPSIKALASLQASQETQGRSFGAMAFVSSLGDLFANLLGTRLYQLSVDNAASLPATLSGGALPFLLFAALLLLVCSLIYTSTTRCRNGAGVEVPTIPQPHPCAVFAFYFSRAPC